MNLHDVFSQKPYTFKAKGKWNRGYVLIFDETEVRQVYTSYRQMEDMVHLLNTAYIEGYLQRSRELGVAPYDEKA